jgi:hypothetical protein
MKTLKQQEQYEVIRLLLATRKNVKICSEGSNKYVTSLLKDMNITFYSCETH